MLFDEIDAFFTDFAVEMTLHEAAADRVIDVLFSEAEMGVYRSQTLNSPDPPFVLVKDEDVTDLDPNCLVTIGVLDYNILDKPIPDGTGLSNIPLERNFDAG